MKTAMPANKGNIKLRIARSTNRTVPGTADNCMTPTEIKPWKPCRSPK